VDLLERSETVAARHPWEIARSRFFIRLLARLEPSRFPTRVLDVGAGDAWLAEQLTDSMADGTTTICWDTNYTPQDLVSLGCPSSAVTLTTEQPQGTFGGIFMLDVIEHVEDDIGFVSRVVEGSLAVDGWMLISVPAYQTLFTSHDAAVKHYRRYSPKQCADVLRAAGLSIEAQGGLFHSLLAVRGAQAARERLAGPNKHWVGAGSWQGGPRLTRVLTSTLEAESRVSLNFATTRKRSLPGLSYWAFCRHASR
jgi:Methyltransferase domain